MSLTTLAERKFPCRNEASRGVCRALIGREMGVGERLSQSAQAVCLVCSVVCLLPYHPAHHSSLCSHTERDFLHHTDCALLFLCFFCEIAVSVTLVLCLIMASSGSGSGLGGSVAKNLFYGASLKRKHDDGESNGDERESEVVPPDWPFDDDLGTANGQWQALLTSSSMWVFSSNFNNNSDCNIIVYSIC